MEKSTTAGKQLARTSCKGKLQMRPTASLELQTSFFATDFGGNKVIISMMLAWVEPMVLVLILDSKKDVTSESISTTTKEVKTTQVFG
jgi:hypothetical protein